MNTPVKSPALASNSPVAASESRIDTFAGAIRDYEGVPGDLNYQLNNPGDCRPSPVGYLPKYEPVVIIDTDTDPSYPFHKGKFAKFPTYALGWEYLQNLILNWAQLHPTWTFVDFFNNFSPSSDQNDPERYAEVVALKCDVPVTTTLGEYFSV